MKVKKINPVTFHVTMPLIGHVSLRKFGAVYDHGLYRQRPWHVTNFGRNFATVGECLRFLMGVERHWYDADTQPPWQPVCHAEELHAFRVVEADLDSCPY